MWEHHVDSKQHDVNWYKMMSDIDSSNPLGFDSIIIPWNQVIGFFSLPNSRFRMYYLWVMVFTPPSTKTLATCEVILSFKSLKTEDSDPCIGGRWRCWKDLLKTSLFFLFFSRVWKSGLRSFWCIISWVSKNIDLANDFTSLQFFAWGSDIPLSCSNYLYLYFILI